MAIRMTHKAISKCVMVRSLATVLLALVSFTVHALNNEKNMPQQVTLELGKKGPASFKQIGTITDHYTAGEVAGFLDLNWHPKQLGIVTIRHNRHGITFPHIFHVMGTMWADYPNEGVTSIKLTGGISSTEFVRHLEAYDLWLKLLNQIKDAGWQPYIELSSERLKGKEALRYLVDNKNVDIVKDPWTGPDYVSWRSIMSGPDPFLIFYQDGVLMLITFMQTISSQEDFDSKNIKLDYQEWGQYMMDIEFETVRFSIREQMHNEFIPDNLDIDKFGEEINRIDADLLGNWPRYLKRQQAERAKREKKLVDNGYKIDTEHKDPDVLPYLQKEPKF